jgi:ABC-type uncharacterized transport system substrate-binding protein
MNRRVFMALTGAAAAWPLRVSAQQQPVPIIGFLSSLSEPALKGPVVAFKQGLQSTGYEQGKNVRIEFRWAEGNYELLPTLAAELVRRQVAIIVTVGGDPPAFAAKAAAPRIPIAFMVGRDPVKLGLVTSLNHPGGNATGINLLITETEAKRVELLGKLTPPNSTLAALVNPKNADAKVQSDAIESAAVSMGQRITIIHVTNDIDLEDALGALRKSHIAGFAVTADPFFVYRREQIIAAAKQERIPAVYFLREFAISGGLASYGTNLAESYRQLGIYAGKILGGTRPADLPVFQPDKFELVINSKTAKALDIPIPYDVLALADEVIE